MANPLTNKLGPLETWQWLAIGGGGGLLLYLYERNKKPKEETGTELAGSTTNPLAEGAGTSGGGEGNSSQPAPVPGVIGEPGPAGAPGTPAEPSGISEARLEALEASVERNNNPPVGSHTVAPVHKGAAFPLVNPANGEHYKVTHEKGKTVHVYHSGRKVVVGAKSKTKAGHTAPAKHGRPKPLKVKAKRPAPKPPRVVSSHAQPKSGSGKPAKRKRK